MADSLVGGLGAVVRAHAAWFAGQGWAVTVAAPGDPAAVLPGASFEPLELPDTMRSVGAVRRARGRLAELSAELRPGVVHCHGLRSFAVARLATRRAPFVTLHGSGPVPSDPPAYHALRRAGVQLVPRLAKRAFTAGPTTAGGWVFLPHASPALARLKRLSFPPAGDPPTFLWIGRLDAPKQPDMFVRALAAMAGVRGVIAGDGPERASLGRLVAELDAPVELLGHQGDLSPLLARAWAVVLLSTHEAVPFAIQEAMWVGRPVVSSDLPGVRWVAGEAAILVPRASGVAGAVAALGRVLDHATAAGLGDRAAEQIRRQLTPDAPWPAVAAAYGPGRP